jgi:VanZ family protein
MRGSLELNVRSFFEKVFTYGAFIWLMTRAGVTLMAATLFGGVLVFGVRLAQVYLPGRSAEITDVIILVAAAAVMRLMGEDPQYLHEEDSRPTQSGQRHSR